MNEDLFLTLAHFSDWLVYSWFHWSALIGLALVVEAVRIGRKHRRASKDS